MTTKSTKGPRSSGLRGIVEVLGAAAAVAVSEALGEQVGSAESAARTLLEELVDRERQLRGEAVANELRARHVRTWPFLAARAPAARAAGDAPGFNNPPGWPFSTKPGQR